MLITNHDIKGKHVTRGGKTYMELQKYTINMRTKRLHVSFKNLFNGDRALGKSHKSIYRLFHLKGNPNFNCVAESYTTY
jgi:hypothetical protein